MTFENALYSAAAKTLLNQLDFELLETQYETPSGKIDFIAKEKDVLCFIKMSVCEEEFSEISKISAEERKKFEKIAIHYLTNVEENCLVRFDHLEVVKVSSQGYFFRLHTNALKEA